jgi:type II secretory pathway pseudopilin PulG
MYGKPLIFYKRVKTVIPSSLKNYNSTTPQVIAAVGVVSIPSALIATGFVEIVQSKIKAKNARSAGATGEGLQESATRSATVAGDDWYEVAYRALENVEPPASKWGPKVDKWQIAVNEHLNGKQDENGNVHYTCLSSTSRAFIFTVIIANIFAVLLESVPMVDKRVGNEAGNFFDVFEFFSVMVFAVRPIACRKIAMTYPL